MVKNIKPIFLLVLIGLFLSACSNASIKKESSQTIQTVKSVFKETSKKPTKSNGSLFFYLPSGFGIQNQTPNNIILRNGLNTYIFFNNPRENDSSHVEYNATIAEYKKLQTNVTFNDNKRFGFVIIKNMKDDLNELTIGIGGTKITTQAKTEDLKSDAKIMMQIVSSVEGKN